MMLLALLTAAAVPALPPNDRVISCDDKPVYLVVAGPTLDRTRMLAYGKAIADSGMYQRLGGYYINSPGAFDLLEGTPPKDYTTLIVRFPCRANALAFWNSRTYQETIKPMRLTPIGRMPGRLSRSIFESVPTWGLIRLWRLAESLKRFISSFSVRWPILLAQNCHWLADGV